MITSRVDDWKARIAHQPGYTAARRIRRWRNVPPSSVERRRKLVGGADQQIVRSRLAEYTARIRQSDATAARYELLESEAEQIEVPLSYADQL